MPPECPTPSAPPSTLPHRHPAQPRRPRPTPRLPFAVFPGSPPGCPASVAVIFAGRLAIDSWVLYKRVAYEREVARLRAGMSDVERRRSDAVTNAKEKRLAMMMELLRRQAKIDKHVIQPWAAQRHGRE